MISLLTQNQSEIAVLCKTYGMRKLEVFGSSVNGLFDVHESDIDLIVDPGTMERTFLSVSSIFWRRWKTCCNGISI